MFHFLNINKINVEFFTAGFIINLLVINDLVGVFSIFLDYKLLVCQLTSMSRIILDLLSCHVMFLFCKNFLFLRSSFKRHICAR